MTPLVIPPVAVTLTDDWLLNTWLPCWIRMSPPFTVIAPTAFSWFPRSTPMVVVPIAFTSMVVAAIIAPTVSAAPEPAFTDPLSEVRSLVVRPFVLNSERLPPIIRLGSVSACTVDMLSPAGVVIVVPLSA